MQLTNESEPVLPTSAQAPEVAFDAPMDTSAPEALSIALPATQPAAEASSALLRAAYVLIFLITLLAASSIWPQAGGQGHLDLMPWYWKLFPPMAFSYAVVRASMAAGEGSAAWNRLSVTWFLTALLFASLIGGLTYYYHLTESQEQVDSDEGIITSVQVPAARSHV